MITNLSKYIEETQIQINKLKSQNQTSYIQFTIKFESPNMVENFKRYWLKEGYRFWFRTCTRGYTDYEISWNNDNKQ